LTAGAPFRRCTLAGAKWLLPFVLGAFLSLASFAVRAEEVDHIRYDLDVAGLNDGPAKDLFKETSILIRQKGNPPPAFAILQQWIQKDIRTLDKILRARAFYSGRVSYQVDRRVQPVRISLLVDSGRQYRITAVDLAFVGSEGGQPVPDREAFSDLLPEVGAPGAAPRILLAQQDILSRLPTMGYPLARLKDRKVVVRHADQSMEVRYIIDPGPYVSFGQTSYRGLESVKTGFLEKLRPWAEGDVYDSRKIAEFRDDLAASSLFASITAALGSPTDDGTAPVNVSLKEADHRSYGGGVSYASDDGFGANLFWEHRNLLGGAEKFRSEARVSEIEQGLATSLTVPAFLRSDQKLILDLELLREAPDAFESYSVNAGAAVERELSPHWSVTLGGSADYTNIRDAEGTRNFYLLGGLASVRRDSTEDLLDPRDGSRVFVTVRPYIGEQDGLLEFEIGEVAGSIYVPLDSEKRYVMAARAKFGTIQGSSLARLPGDKRFYAGGGQSVRGFGYQLAGDLDAEGDPVGGRSLVEVGAEMRLRVWDNIGIVPFVEGGRAFEGRTPRPDKELFWGAGVGLRYYTSFAPLRLDIGFPLNPRETDDSFQIYISLGQSF